LIHKAERKKKEFEEEEVVNDAFHAKIPPQKSP